MKLIGPAREDFAAFAAESMTAALLAVCDIHSYALGESMPPNGTTHVVL